MAAGRCIVAEAWETNALKQNQGLQGQARGEVRALLWWPPCRLRPHQPRTLLRTGRGQSRAGGATPGRVSTH